jgi:hypothetical protein
VRDRHARRPRVVRAGLVVLILLWRAGPGLAAPKTDVVEFLNGDRITCEIRKLDRGKLTVKTDGIGTISIEWDDVAFVTSPSSFDIELASGDRVFGSLAQGDTRTVDVMTMSGSERLSLGVIVRITPLGGTFWRRLDGAIDAGFNFTQANVQTQWTFHTEVDYRGRKWQTGLSGDSALTTREDADRQSRNTLILQTQRFLGPRWSGVGFAQFQQNEELSLDLRAVLGGGIMKVLTQSNNQMVTAIGGAAHTREQYEGADDENVGEAIAGLRWEWFTFDGRSTNLNTSALSFSALRRDARLRLEVDTSFKSYWSINVFESYNSDPPDDQKRNDFGVSATLGWSF